MNSKHTEKEASTQTKNEQGHSSQPLDSLHPMRDTILTFMAWVGAYVEILLFGAEAKDHWNDPWFKVIAYTFGPTLGGVIYRVFSRTFKWRRSISAAAGIIIAIAVSGLILRSYLYPAKGNGLDEPTFSEVASKLGVRLGDSSITCSREELESGTEPFRIHGKIPMVIKLENGKLFVNAEFSNGRRQVKFERNQLINTPVGWDVNKNSKAIEVIDETGVPVFQFIYTSPTTVQILGSMFSDGTTIYMTNDGIEIGPISEFGQRRPKLKPIFKHPAWKYPGEYAD